MSKRISEREVQPRWFPSKRQFIHRRTLNLSPKPEVALLKSFWSRALGVQRFCFRRAARAKTHRPSDPMGYFPRLSLTSRRMLQASLLPGHALQVHLRKVQVKGVLVGESLYSLQPQTQQAASSEPKTPWLKMEYTLYHIRNIYIYIYIYI